jgi:cytochrome P450
MSARTAVQNLTPWLRPFKAASLPEVIKLARHEEEFKNILKPIITARRKAEKEEAGYEKPDDMLQWLMDDQKYGTRDDREQAKLQLGITFAAIHTTTLTATNALVLV